MCKSSHRYAYATGTNTLGYKTLWTWLEYFSQQLECLMKHYSNEIYIRNT